MRITDLIRPEAVALGQNPKNKEQALNLLIDLHAKAGNITDKEVYKKGILEREDKGTTAIGEGLAMPHAKNRAVVKPALAAMTVPDGVDCQSMDKRPTNLFFMIAAPEERKDVHLEVLAHLNMMLMDENFRKHLLEATSTEDFLAIINQKEIEKFGEKENTQDEVKKTTESKDGYRILAVTACPTGIAHTYMAAEALELKAKEMGITLKVETNGSGGTKNILTKQEIEACDGIIVAADKNVEMARFAGKRVVKVKVADGIHEPEKLIKRIVNQDAPVYEDHGDAQNATNAPRKEGFGHQIYQHLMNGVSHMLPFVIGGGILIAIAFLIDNYEINPENFGSNTPIAGFFKHIGDLAFGFMLPILAGYIAMSIADRPGLVAGFVGGAIAASGMTLTAAEGISSGFLGALVAGYLGGYLMVGLKKLFSVLPKSLEGIKPVLLYPLFGILSTGFIMCLIAPAVGGLNTVLTNGLNAMGGSSKIVLGCVLGGMMAIDMGGPFNKAAYVFGTASLAAGNNEIMAAVMVGGMIPPLVIALSTTLFKNIWTAEERKSGLVNYVMGLCFISEGAIPFAAADPLRVIPSCILGSAIAGGISMAVGATLRAPHGGIFVFPLIGNALGYMIALLVGAFVGMALLTMLKMKKRKKEKKEHNYGREKIYNHKCTRTSYETSESDYKYIIST